MDVNVKVAEKRRDALKIIAAIEKREMRQVLAEIIDDYLERHEETLAILAQPGGLDAILEGAAEIKGGKFVKWQDLRKKSGV